MNIEEYNDFFRLNSGKVAKLNYILNTFKVLSEDENYSEIVSGNDNKLIERLKRTDLINSVNFTVITGLTCNMNCAYCYQKADSFCHTERIDIDKITSYIKDKLDKGEQKASLTLVGGEPLLEENKDFINKLYEDLSEYNLDKDIVTNGINICKFKDEILKWNINYVQITIDGIEEINNSRRYSTVENYYENILSGIEFLLENEIHVHLRINIDENNIKNIIDLLNLLKEIDFFRSNYFYAYIYPVTYSGNPDYKLWKDESELLKCLLEHLKENEIDITKFMSLDFHGLSYINKLINGQTPRIITTFCGAFKNQYVINTDGNIYSCWWGVGLEKFHIETIEHQTFSRNNDIKIFTIEQCKACKYKFICGSGCEFKAHINNDIKHCYNFYENIETYLNYLDYMKKFDK